MATKFDEEAETTLQVQCPSNAKPTSKVIDLQSPEVCVICLDRVSEKAIALPCGHDQFDFPCLGTWLQCQRVCPLCKREVRAIKYDVEDQSSTKIFHLPPQEVPHRVRASAGQSRTRHNPYNRRPRNVVTNSRSAAGTKNTALDRRKMIYRDNLYCLHVGTNRISRYRNVSPSSFSTDDHLVSRARMFIRRELSVFDFLNPDSTSFAQTDRRASNAEFLLEYIIGILKSIDLKGCTGQAQELLKDFLGRDNAKLFLHELEAWLRSPYESLKDWDRAVQYAEVAGSQWLGSSS